MKLSTYAMYPCDNESNSSPDKKYQFLRINKPEWDPYNQGAINMLQSMAAMTEQEKQRSRQAILKNQKLLKKVNERIKSMDTPQHTNSKIEKQRKEQLEVHRQEHQRLEQQLNILKNALVDGHNQPIPHIVGNLRASEPKTYNAMKKMNKEIYNFFFKDNRIKRRPQFEHDSEYTYSTDYPQVNFLKSLCHKETPENSRLSNVASISLLKGLRSQLMMML